MRSLLYLTGRTPSPFPAEPEQVALKHGFDAVGVIKFIPPLFI
jgi:hypothetical protein